MADFTGKWVPFERDEESFVKYFEAMGAPDGKMALEKFRTAAGHEMIDRGDTIILRIPDEANKGQQKDLEFKVGEEVTVVGPLGIPTKKFVTREGNKLIFEETIPSGKKSTTIREIQGDKMLFSKRDNDSGVTARGVLVREKSDH